MDTQQEILAVLKRQEQAEKNKKLIAGIVTLIFLAPIVLFVVAVF